MQRVNSITKWIVTDRVAPKPTLQQGIRSLWSNIEEAIEIGNCPATRKKAKIAMVKLATLLKRMNRALNEYQEQLDAYESGLQFLEYAIHGAPDE